MRPDPRPAKRHKATTEEWAEITITAAERDGFGCLLCGQTPVTRHHVVSRSLGGSDVPANIVMLCGTGTTGCHGLVEARDEDACQQLGLFLHENVAAYVTATKGQGFLERYLGVMS